MKEKIFYSTLILAILILISGCGSETGTPRETEIVASRTSSDRAGTSSRPLISQKAASFGSPEGFGIISVNIAADRSTLPLNSRNLVVTCDDFSVYKAGEGWRSLPLAASPFNMNLCRLPRGKTKNLVPPVKVPVGEYKNIRIGVTRAIIRMWRRAYPINIPPYSLKTVKAVDFEMVSGGTIDLTLAFDLSRSLMDYGSRNFVLNPAFNVVETEKAVALLGNIKGSPFDSSRGLHSPKEAVVTVYCDDNNNFKPDYGEDYTKIRLRVRSNPSSFRIHWLAPHKNYIVSIVMDGREIYSEVVEAPYLHGGSVFALNNANPI